MGGSIALRAHHGLVRRRRRRHRTQRRVHVAVARPRARTSRAVMRWWCNATGATSCRRCRPACRSRSTASRWPRATRARWSRAWKSASGPTLLQVLEEPESLGASRPPHRPAAAPVPAPTRMPTTTPPAAWPVEPEVDLLVGETGDALPPPKAAPGVAAPAPPQDLAAAFKRGLGLSPGRRAHARARAGRAHRGAAARDDGRHARTADRPHGGQARARCRGHAGAHAGKQPAEVLARRRRGAVASARTGRTRLSRPRGGGGRGLRRPARAPGRAAGRHARCARLGDVALRSGGAREAPGAGRRAGEPDPGQPARPPVEQLQRRVRAHRQPRSKTTSTRCSAAPFSRPIRPSCRRWLPIATCPISKAETPAPPVQGEP